MLRHFLSSAVLWTAFCAIPASPTLAGEPVKVMAMGDSHTVGLGSTHLAGYRLAFKKAMTEGGYEADMVGGNADGPEGFDHRHQGYGGATAYEVSAFVHDKMSLYDPDLVVLLVGTNDADLPGFNPLAFQIQFSVLVDRVFAANPDVKLIVSTIPPQQYGHNENAVRAVNDRIRRYIEGRRNRAQIRIVDVFNLVDDRLDMSDKLHMNDAGYEKVGRAFADAAIELLATDVAGKNE